MARGDALGQKLRGNFFSFDNTMFPHMRNTQQVGLIFWRNDVKLCVLTGRKADDSEFFYKRELMSLPDVYSEDKARSYGSVVMSGCM